MKLKQLLATSLFIGSAAVLVNPVLAQSGPEKEKTSIDKKEYRQKRHAKMVEMRARLLREKVGLSESKASKAEAVLAKFDQKHRENREKVHGARKNLQNLVASNSSNAAEYSKLIKEFRAAHEAMHGLRNAQFDALASVLSPPEQAKLLLELGHMKKRFHHGKGKHGWGSGTCAKKKDGSGPGRTAPSAK